MPMHLAAWNDNTHRAALTAIAALTDPVLRVQGNDIIVPTIPRLGLIYGLGANLTQLQLTSPSIRRMWPLDCEPIDQNAAASVPTPWLQLYEEPLQLAAGEALDALVVDNAAGANQKVVLVQFIDGPAQPVRGDIFTMKCTGTTTLTAFAWTNVPLTLSQQLPVGTYQLVGMRAESTGVIAARAVFIGGGWRPGCIGFTTVSKAQWDPHRLGRTGVWGTFDNLTPPSIDFLSASADTAETVWLDCIKIS